MFTGPTSSGYSWSCQVPRAPLHEPGVTSLVVISWTTSAGITPPSSLLRTHAPILHPPRASVVPSNTRSLQVAVSPCWEENLPDVTLRIFPYVLGPLPRPLLRCMYPLLPARQRPSPREDKVGAAPCSVQRLQHGASFGAAVIHACSGPQVCSPPRSLLPIRLNRMAAVTCKSGPLVVRYLPTPRICLPSESGN